MEFDKSKVYTALNAEELEVGSEVMLADNLESLKQQVEANSWPTHVKRLDWIMGASFGNRFNSGGLKYNLAYLVRKVAKEEEQWIVYLAREQDFSYHLEYCAESFWAWGCAKPKLFVGTHDEAKEWCQSRQKFAKFIKAFEDGKTIQVRVSDTDEWSDCVVTPEWSYECEYRVKPKEEKWIAYLARPKNDNCYLTSGCEDLWEYIQKDYHAKTKLYVGSESEVKEWYKARQKFAKVIEAWEDGKAIQVKNGCHNWFYIKNPGWDVNCEYRVKPENKKLSEKEFKGWKSFKYNAGGGLYAVYVDHYSEPHLDFGSYAQWDKIQEYKGAKNKLFAGSKEECRAWCDSHDKFAREILAWENGKEIQFYSPIEERWKTLNNPSWGSEWEYRVKPNGLVWTDLKMGNILRRAGEKPAPLGGRDEYAYVKERRMVTGIVDDSGTKRHVQLGGDWIDDEDLEKWSVEK